MKTKTRTVYRKECKEEGCSVVICDLDKEKLAETESELSNYGNVLAVPTDVTDVGDVKRLVNTAVEKFGTIGILINNAGILGGERPFHELSLDDWETMYDVNIKGTVRVTKEILPYMRKQGWDGSPTSPQRQAAS